MKKFNSIQPYNPKNKVLTTVGNRVVLLDLIRIFALLMVIFVHLAQFFKSPFGGFFGIQDFYWVSLGGVAVTVFIILSGFVLEMSYGNKKYNYLGFIVKRLKYIYPIYWYALSLALIINIILNNTHLITTEISNFQNLILFLSGTYAFVGRWSGPFIETSWFIGLIVTLYLFFPLLSRSLKKKPLLTLFSLLLVSITTRLIVGQTNLLPNRALDWFPLSRIFEFYLGMFLATSQLIRSKILLMNNISFTKQINFLAELSFPAFLVHFPLLSVLGLLIPKVSVGLAIVIYTLLTFCLSFLIVKIASFQI